MSSTPPDDPPAPAAAPQSPIPAIEILTHHQEGSTWSTFHRIAYRLRRADGTWLPGEREFLDRGDAVALLPFCPATGTVLLTRQFRVPVYLRHPAESMLLEVCGGILDDPDPTVTLRHEAVEELGLHLTHFEKVFEAYSTPGSVCEKVHFFVAPYTPGQRLHRGGGIPHEGEDIEILELPLAEALRLTRTGGIRDLRTIALLFYLAATVPATLPAILPAAPSAT